MEVTRAFWPELAATLGCALLAFASVSPARADVVAVGDDNRTISVDGGDTAESFLLGRSGKRSLNPSYNPRFSEETREYHGFNVEVGTFDPRESTAFDPVLGGSRPDGAYTPRFEGEASYVTRFTTAGRVRAFVTGLYQPSRACVGCSELWSLTPRDQVEAWGASGGVSVGWSGFEITFSGYTGKTSGSALDEDPLYRAGEERKTGGWRAQVNYLFPNKQTAIGFNYGQSKLSETLFARGRHRWGQDPLASAGDEASYLDQRPAFSVGVYHDVTSWFKVMGEYSSLDQQWLNGQEQDSDLFVVRGLFRW